MRSRSRTATPGKTKSDPNIEAQDIFINIAKQYEREQLAATQTFHRPASQSVTSQNIPSQTSTAPTSAPSRPQQVIIYGFGDDQGWAALAKYEKATQGIILEDYSRYPPDSYHTTVSPPMSREERELVCRARVGAYWMKITFRDARDAEQAMRMSPISSLGHLVYCIAYQGQDLPNEFDRPFPEVRDDNGQLLSHLMKAPYNFGGGSISNQLSLSLAPPPSDETSATDSVTASSATATGNEPVYPQLRRRSEYDQSLQLRNRNTADYMKRFPDQRATPLRPISEALPPRKTFLENVAAHFPVLDLDYIGEGVPRLDNGEFDWNRANLYWRLLYLLDRWTYSNFTGIKDESE